MEGVNIYRFIINSGAYQTVNGIDHIIFRNLIKLSGSTFFMCYNEVFYLLASRFGSGHCLYIFANMCVPELLVNCFSVLVHITVNSALQKLSA